MSRVICVDPGETTGWSVWTKDCAKLLGGGQTAPGWQFVQDLHDAVTDNVGPIAEHEDVILRSGVEPDENVGPIDLIVIERFAIYPWKAKELAWEELRTVQFIGAITFICQLHGIAMHKQAATIKERAKAGGAESLFTRPLQENRHENDSIMHGFYYGQVEVGNANPAPPSMDPDGK